MLQTIYIEYKYPLFATMVILLGILLGFGITAVYTVIILGLLELTLSFDNAVLNAKVLQKMSPFWQTIFLTVGIAIAVIGVRFIMPSAIVSGFSDLTFMESISLAIDNPIAYKEQLEHANPSVSMFGGTFLLCIFINFLIDSKDNNWLFFEKWIQIDSDDKIEKFVGTLIFCIIFITFMSIKDTIFPAIFGFSLYYIIQFITNKVDDIQNDSASLISSGLINFIYLEILDASLSFDGVIGAFAITNNIVLIMAGLAIGAIFVRSMTTHVVKTGAIDEFIYLEHGAHYAIGILAIIMGLSVSNHIPEVVTSLSAIGIIGMSFYSSIKYNKLQTV